MSDERWTGVAERGTRGGLRFGAWFHRRFGRRPSIATLWLPSLYYYAANPVARRASRQYLEHIWASSEGRAALVRKPGPRAVLHHLHEFAVTLYDRMVTWGGALDTMKMEHDGSEKILELAAAGRGALLLGSHLGSIDLLWSLSQRHRLKMNVVLFYQNAERVNAFFESLGNGDRVRAIDIDPESVSAVFQVRACIERGEFVMILADRMAPGKATRSVRTTFLGRPASFPLAPFLLGGVLGCPVLLALCVRTGDARYRTVLRTLGEATRAPRAERENLAREQLERYVAHLEATCHELPFQWFNFYDFWADGDEAAS